MLGKGGAKGSWHFIWPMPNKAAVQEFEKFISLSVVRGIHHTVVLAELVKRYNADFMASRPELRGVTLVDEKFLLTRLKRDRTPVSRVLLSQYRSNGKLTPRDGKPLYWTSGRRVVYSLEGCKAFFRDRKAA